MPKTIGSAPSAIRPALTIDSRNVVIANALRPRGPALARGVGGAGASWMPRRSRAPLRPTLGSTRGWAQGTLFPEGDCESKPRPNGARALTAGRPAVSERATDADRGAARGRARSSTRGLLAVVAQPAPVGPGVLTNAGGLRHGAGRHRCNRATGPFRLNLLAMASHLSAPPTEWRSVSERSAGQLSAG